MDRVQKIAIQTRNVYFIQEKVEKELGFQVHTWRRNSTIDRNLPNVADVVEKGKMRLMIGS